MQRIGIRDDPDGYIIEASEKMKTVCKRFSDSGMTPEQEAERIHVSTGYLNELQMDVRSLQLRQRRIDSFVNAVYLNKDIIVCAFNDRNGSEAIVSTEAEGRNLCVPCSKKNREERS